MLIVGAPLPWFPVANGPNNKQMEMLAGISAVALRTPATKSPHKSTSVCESLHVRSKSIHVMSFEIRQPLGKHSQTAPFGQFLVRHALRCCCLSRVSTFLILPFRSGISIPALSASPPLPRSIASSLAALLDGE